jgi:uncharacterized membrane protein YfcA
MNNTPHTAPRWPTGWLILAGLLAGALLGALLGQLPLGTMVGLALGVGIDSLLNYRLNQDRSEG